MITQLEVSNYRSLGRDVTLKFGQLSVLIGPNGSGKSNTLDVLSFVRDAVTQGLPAAVTHRNGIDSVRRRSPGHPYNVSIRLSVTTKSGHAHYYFVITGDKREEYRVKTESASVTVDGSEHLFLREGAHWKGPEGLAPRIDGQSLALTTLGGDARFKPLVDVLSGITIYAIFPDTLRAPQKFDSSRPMKRHGENWVSILRELVKQDAKEDLIEGLKRLTGDITDARVSSAAGYLIAEFRQIIRSEKSKRWFDAAQQSDGTLRVAGILTALLQSPTLPVVGIEEPELTVHPGALPMLYDFLKQASETSQVIITTHSPIVLDVVNVESDAIFVVNRVDGKTAVKRASRLQLKPVRKSLLRLGDLFLSGDLQLSIFESSEDENE